VRAMPQLLPAEPGPVASGAVHLPGWLDLDGQGALVDACRGWGEASGGFRSPSMPSGGTMSVEITCLGWHWFPYRYVWTREDGDGREVARFPEWLGDLARDALRAAAAVDPALAGAASYRPDVALVNWYGPDARMGMHVDREEPSPAPVVSLSLGDGCVFRFGTPAGRGRPWTDVLLGSGDLFVFGGASRRAYHGVPKLFPGTAPAGIGLEGGRFNITVRETGLTDPR
jgi:DNA oxidative demethylase